MYSSLSVMLISGILLAAFLILLQAESAQNKRLVLSRVRSRWDIMITTWQERGSTWSKHFGAGSLRILLHYLAHQVLGLILYIIHFVEDNLDALRHRNKVIARAVKDRDKNHLDHIAEHKESTALSDTEKQTLRERHLEES